MADEYEVIAYAGTNYVFSLGRASYVCPHVHREFEFGVVLDGQMRIITPEKRFVVNRDEVWLTNSCESHEVYAGGVHSTYTYLIVQLSPAFFRPYLPDIDRLRFDTGALTAENTDPALLDTCRRLLMDSAMSYFAQEPYYKLTCAANINLLLRTLLQAAEHTWLDSDLQNTRTLAMERIRRLTAYAEEHMGEKVQLSELAEREGLTLNYFSHFVKNSLGMSFQEYMARIRCERARAMIISTEDSLTDISISCGFSALKYMNSDFEKLYGVTPKEYRAAWQAEHGSAAETTPEQSFIPAGQRNTHQGTICRHLTPEESLRYLKRYRSF